MAREIKFRGKTLNGDWVEGAYFAMRHGDERKHTHHFIIPDGTPIQKERPIGEIQVEIDPETLGQFTECYDNYGKPVYEGDIIESIWADDSRGVDIVGFQDGEYGLMNNYAYNSKLKGFKFPCFMSHMFREICLRKAEKLRRYVVIGNVYDNPELLMED